MTNSLDSTTAKSQAFLVTFAWDIQTAKYTTYSKDLTISSVTYSSVPEMELDFNGFTALPEADTVKIKIPDTYSPINTLSEGRAHAPVSCEIFEVNPEDTTSKRLLLQGKISSLENDSDGVSGITEIIVSDALVFLDMALGLVATSTCQWTFGDENNSPCGVALAPLKVSAGILSVTGLSIKTDASPATSSYFVRGYIEKDSVRINIRDAINGTVTLTQYPPSSWAAGNSVILVPGCDKQKSTCSTRWSNESQFMGLGIAMPNYNPVYEGGS